MREEIHTPGPWHVTDNYALWPSKQGKEPRAIYINPAIMEASICMVASGIAAEDSVTQEVCLANARLIAAAPELLNALQLLYPLARKYAETHRTPEGESDWSADRITEIYETAVAKAAAA